MSKLTLLTIAMLSVSIAVGLFRLSSSQPFMDMYVHEMQAFIILFTVSSVAIFIIIVLKVIR
jgi:hypothetical protein